MKKKEIRKDKNTGNMSNEELPSDKKLSTATKLILGMAAFAVILILFILGLWQFQDRMTKFRSRNYPYSLTYNETKVKYELLRVDERPTFMERFSVKNAAESYYLSVISVDAEVDIEDALEAFQKDGSYEFHREENVTCGSEGYTATRLSYVDKTGREPAEINYYYLKKEGLWVSTCSDEAHKELIEEMLKSFTITK